MATPAVAPLHNFDDTPLWKAFILYYVFVFDSVLDPEHLKNSLELLARRDGWKKFGARLRKNANGNLEYHFPETTDTEKSPRVVSYTHVTHSTATAEHPIACHIPNQAIGRPSVVADPDRLEGLFRPDGAPTKITDYLNKDIPQMGLHVVSFLDKTLVTVYFPHTLMDGMSMAPFLEAWILALQGRASEIKCPIGAEDCTHELSNDPLAAFGVKPTAKHVLENHQMSIVGLTGWALRNIRSFFDDLENRMVCVPASVVARLRQEAIIASAAHCKAEGGPPFLSDGDILCSWWTRIVLTSAGVSHNSNKTIVLNNAYSLRKILLDSQRNSEKVQDTETATDQDSFYVSNVTAFFSVVLTAGEILQQPLHRTAIAFRDALDMQRTRPQAEAFLSTWRRSWGKIPPIFGNWKMDLITYSNWTRANLFDFDFSAAVLGAGEKQRPVRPVYVQNNQFGLKLPNAFPIIGKDRSGNYWLSGYLKKGQWGRIEDQLANL
ncbi:hypothetical protein J7T55_012474 [Diaporthe amygdali]|uniref:uncharacterized protein n=1 Tax=Phomopsis amygdali TaxID=1214568 RepID=UPI0022FEB9A9|nr:uncharacterized protein J7T55_012474 [Diaporthe amygdali]KAJ0124001.1 hypothetical protein J7T55_012474 [Diaporthe amygdali]